MKFLTSLVTRSAFSDENGPEIEQKVTTLAKFLSEIRETWRFLIFEIPEFESNKGDTPYLCFLIRTQHCTINILYYIFSVESLA